MKPIKQSHIDIPWANEGIIRIAGLLTEGALGEHAVYMMAHMPGEPIDASHVMSHGQKATYEMALQFFPTLEKSNYRS